MKFDCGITYDEKCKIKSHWREHWHEWFAIVPRRVGPRECRWLEYVERKGKPYFGYVCGFPPGVKVKKWRYEFRRLSDD